MRCDLLTLNKLNLILTTLRRREPRDSGIFDKYEKIALNKY